LVLAVCIGALCWWLGRFLPFPPGKDPSAACRLLFVVGLTTSSWLLAAMPIAAASLLPLALLPLLGVESTEKLTAGYGHPILWLFGGGFVLAMAVERSALHRRLALRVAATLGPYPRRLVTGFFVVATCISMWINNTSVALLLLPIGTVLVDRMKALGELTPRAQSNFGAGIMCAIAFGASIGGMGTPIGTAPNAVFFGAYEPLVQAGARPVSFLTWTLAFAPYALLLAVLSAFVVVRFALPLPGRRLVRGDELLREARELGRWSKAEVRTAVLFGFAVVLWMTRGDVQLGAGEVLHGWAHYLVPAGERDRYVADGTVAVLVAILAFLIPSGSPDGRRLVDWQTARQMPFDLLLLLGGGLALADAFDPTGLSRAFGELLKPWIGAVHPAAAATVSRARDHAAVGVREQHRGRDDVDADPARRRRRRAHRPARAHAARRARVVVRLHAADRHAAEHDRVRVAADHVRPDGARRYLHRSARGRRARPRVVVVGVPAARCRCRGFGRGGARWQVNDVRRSAGWICTWLGAFFSFAAVAHGNFETHDAAFTMHAARALWVRGDSGLLTTEQGGELLGERMGAEDIARMHRNGRIGTNGRAYVWFPMGHVWLMVPFVAAGEWLHKCLPAPEAMFRATVAPGVEDSALPHARSYVLGHPVLTQGLICLLLPASVAATSVLLLFLLARALGATPRDAAITTVAISPRDAVSSRWAVSSCRTGRVCVLCSRCCGSSCACIWARHRAGCRCSAAWPPALPCCCAIRTRCSSCHVRSRSRSRAAAAGPGRSSGGSWPVACRSRVSSSASTWRGSATR
jgi:sodium-dependent dicarboxylate transporter 2/3/5